MSAQGESRLVVRRSGGALLGAALAGAAWPPLVLTLPVWPPENWAPGLDMDPRLVLLVVGLIFVPFGLWRVLREHERTGRPATRFGVVWRFALFGGLAVAGVQAGAAILISVLGASAASGVEQAAGFTETALLIYGMAGLVVASLIGASYGVWAGLCVAFIAFESRTGVRDRLGLMRRGPN